MRLQFCIFCIIFFFYSCFDKDKVIKIAIENNSDLKHSIEISTYLGDSLIDKRMIKRDTSKVSFSNFEVNLSKAEGKKEFSFIVTGSNERTNCIVFLDSLDKTALLHVNYLEVLFKKGYQYKSEILTKDTVVQKEFYCEIMNKR